MIPRARVLLALAFVPFVTTVLLAQTPPPAPVGPLSATLTFNAYLARVARSNLEYAAQRVNVPIAEAQISIARIFPDPVVSVGAGPVDVSGVGAQNGVSVGVTVPIEFPTKVSARVSVARTQRMVALAELEDFYRDLRATAANAFVDALHARLVLEQRRRTLESLERLVVANEERLRTGDVGEVAVVQSRLEAQRFRADVLAAEGEVRAMDLALVLHFGSARDRVAAPVFAPSGDLRTPARSFDLDALIVNARNRPDVRARRAELASARARLELAHANRGIDIAVNLGWQYNFPGAQGSAFQAPGYQSVGVSVSVPIPISRMNRGELDLASASVAQAEAQLRATELRAEVQVRQALARYEAAVARMNLYTGGLLAAADRVLESMLYSYQRGNATLLEVLNAQRTVNDVYLAYYDALSDHAHGLIEVERAAGIWDLSF